MLLCLHVLRPEVRGMSSGMVDLDRGLVSCRNHVKSEAEDIVPCLCLVPSGFSCLVCAKPVSGMYAADPRHLLSSPCLVSLMLSEADWSCR